LRPILRVRPQADAEMGEAVRWYESQRRGLGLEFLFSARQMLSTIEDAPERFPKVRGEVRRALLRRFPYGILYLVEPEEIVVIGCFHSKRDPQRWQSRR
jgi:plasmid stabilization system protein ParE